MSGWLARTLFMTSWRRDWITRPIFGWAQKALPSMSETERAAIEAGDVWWDADLFAGNPDWDKLLAFPPAKLSTDEVAFLDGPVEELCDMLNDWQINQELGDLPPAVWKFMKSKKFFGMIIPKSYGGLGFSAYAHSEVVRKISTRSITAAVTVMVPNSLGPGELLHQFGTKEQQDRWLPRLADGREVPCFGLTSPEAGSDAASMTDTGVVTMGPGKSGNVLGIRLNWHKRYITLGPVATVLGLAFKLKDPDNLLGRGEDIGITVALVPTDTDGVEIGRRHMPSGQMFQNGPNWGRDVFVPMDSVIGGEERVGQGWQMLMSALAAGRGISLPSLSAAGIVMAAHTTGAYAAIRNQFNIPIGKFEGVQERLARMAASAYVIDGARRLTCAGLDMGKKPAVISGIMKYHATERMRTAINDAMDVHAGKAVIDGPLNYLTSIYRGIPIGITVEGANILTRCLIIFGQGAIRSHPYLLSEMLALGHKNKDRALAHFDKAFWAHVGLAVKNLFRAWGRAWTGGRFAPAPDAGPATPHFRQLSRYSAAFLLAADMALLTMGGALKRREMLSARYGDILSELFLLSAALKRWHDEGRQEADLPLLDYAMQTGFLTIEQRFDEIFANLPSRLVAWKLRLILMPFGIRRRGPSDALMQATAEILLTPSAARDRLTTGIARDAENEGLKRLQRAFELVIAAEPIREKMKSLGARDPALALERGFITRAEAEQMKILAEAVSAVVAVDDFAPEEISALVRQKSKGDVPSQPRLQPQPPQKSKPQPKPKPPRRAKAAAE
jgi:acyl-CoA dehydrogenase